MESPEVGWSDLNLSKFYLMMPVSSMLMRALVYPIQLIKTRIQASKVYSFLSFFFFLKKKNIIIIE